MAKLLEHPPPGEVDALVAYVDKVKRFFGWCNADPAALSAGGPLATQDGIDQVAAPLALEPAALQQVALKAHPSPFQHGGQAGVAVVAGGADPMLAALDEQVVQQPADRLGGIAIPLVLGRQGEADPGLAWIVGSHVGRAVADQPIRAAWGDGELEPFAGRVGIGGLKFLQELACLAGPVGRLPVLVAATSGRTGRRPRRPGPGAGTGATPAAVWSAP